MFAKLQRRRQADADHNYRHRDLRSPIHALSPLFGCSRRDLPPQTIGNSTAQDFAIS